MTEKRQCEECGVFGDKKTIRTLKTVKGSTDHERNLCKKCWNAEMVWRRNKNKMIPAGARFPIKPWRS